MGPSFRDLNGRNYAIQKLNKFTTVNRKTKGIHFIFICLFKPNNITSILNSFKRCVTFLEVGTSLSVGLSCFHLFEEQTIGCSFYFPL